MEIKNRYSPSEKVKFYTKGPSKTKQEFRDECNINKIMERYNKRGILPEMILQDPKYGDYSEVKSYQDALNTVMHADEQFRNLSVDVRDRFQNNPEKFLEFVNNPKNKQELAELGLLKPEVIEEMKKQEELKKQEVAKVQDK